MHAERNNIRLDVNNLFVILFLNASKIALMIWTIKDLTMLMMMMLLMTMMIILMMMVAAPQC